MKRVFCVLCVLALLSQMASVPALAEEGLTLTLRLPGALEYVDEEAFQGDASIRSLAIPAGVKGIGGRAFDGCGALKQIAVDPGAEVSFYQEAFSGCAGLEQLVIGENADVSLYEGVFSGCASPLSIMISAGASVYFDDNALSGCGDVTFYVHSGTPEELYALSHGYKTVTLDSESSLDQARAMIASYGVMPSMLQDDDPFETKRLIITTSADRLPDISAYHPVEIVRDGDNTYYVQFATNVDTVNCYNDLYDIVELVEPDMLLSSHLNFYGGYAASISAAGTTSSGVWGTDDPMGFDYYSDYVESVGSGSVTIAVIDSGIARGNGYDDLLIPGVNMASDGDAEDWDQVYNYHGSIIASIIKSCVGNASVRILPIRIEEATGSIDTILLAKSIDYAVSHGADIINLSLKLDQKSAIVTAAIGRAVGKGVKVVAAAGNASIDVSRVYPANVESVVAVAGIAPGNKLSGASGFGAGISYGAPSESVTHTLPGGISGGTSFAAPQIASALALVALDPNHDISDLNSACLAIPGAGHGMPQLNTLAHIPTTSVRFDGNTPSVMIVGGEHSLGWTVAPAKATDRTVSITSSDNTVVSVERADGGATLRALKAGEADITLAANDGASPAVTHHIEVVQPVEQVRISGPVYSTWVGAEPIQFSAEIEPQNASNPTVQWYSSNAAIASVDQNGMVIPRGKGIVIITADAQDGYGAYGSRFITVNEYPDAEGIVISDGVSTTDATAYMGAALQLRAYVSPEDAQQAVEWSVEPGTGSASVSQDGLVTPTAAGTVTIRAAVLDNSDVSATFSIVIYAAPESATASVSGSIAYPGNTATMRAAIAPANAYAPEVTWKSTNPDVVKVDPNTGAVTALAVGTASVYAEIDATRSGSAVIPGGAIFESNHVQFTVKASPVVFFDANGGSVNPSNKTVYEGLSFGELPTPVRPDYRFDGWFTADNALITADTVCGRTEDFTLIAHWTSLKFTVSFNANGGSVSQPTLMATVNTALGTLPTPTRDYYHFTGWYTSSVGGQEVKADKVYETASNVTVYAHWELNDYGSWSDWSTTSYTKSANRDVETRTVELSTNKTVYHYRRWVWKKDYFTSYMDVNHNGTAGVYQETTSYTPFTYHKTWNGYDGAKHKEYKGTKVDGCYYWYDEWTTNEKQVTGYETQYRYRDRVK